MRRRDVLRAGAGLAAVPLVAQAASAQDSDDEEFAPTGSVALPSAKEAVVGDDGETVFVATTDGYAVVDASDPASPEVVHEERGLLADREHGPMGYIYDVKVDGDTLIVVGPASGNEENALKGVLVYDVSDPASPERTAFHETDFNIHNSFLHDGVAYLTAGLETVLVDVSGDEPTELSRWRPEDHNEEWGSLPEVGRSAHDVYVHGDTLYVAHWDAGTWLVDVSDPANPSHVNNFGPYDPSDLQEKDMWTEVYEVPGNSHYVAVNDDATLLGTGAEAWETTPDDEPAGAPGGIDLWDISDPQNPEKLAFVEAPPGEDQSFEGEFTTSHNFDIRGDYLYTSWYHGGVKVHDISDPANPEELAAWSDPDQATFWTAQHLGDGAFVASNYAGSDAYPTGLYTFPDQVAEQTEGATTTTQPTTSQPTTTRPTTSEPTTAATTTAEPTTESTTSEATAAPTTESGDSNGESGGGAPGFGVLAGVSALAGAALAAARRAE